LKEELDAEARGQRAGVGDYFYFYKKNNYIQTPAQTAGASAIIYI
jgi:hypothetical protein